ncbi:hypothetical protein HMY34_03830 [Thiothrix subterranea]|uniref:type ISP restriction/modification enzyme n=1 Tax=Thiothrix subterranea TaxID=2735563 RepID=UPI00192C1955|nr:type ISP restriction/modification enzyme [Thiothrix subterranea]QQZ27953.1 hypothetical protein HMY34_03830 [Thiothrix subterranea]
MSSGIWKVAVIVSFYLPMVDIASILYVVAHHGNYRRAKKLDIYAPQYVFSNKDTSSEKSYNKGFSLSDLFHEYYLGPNSHRDHFAIAFEKREAEERVADFMDNSISNEEFSRIYGLSDNRDWKIDKARSLDSKPNPVKCLYRPFDFRYMLYGSYAFDYHRPSLNDQLQENNVGLIFTRQTKENFSVFISSIPLGQHKIATPYDGSYAAALYLYSKDNSLYGLESKKMKLNVKSEISKKISKISKIFKLEFSDESVVKKDGFLVAIDIIDYAYGVLYSPAYRKKYAEFLKSDFPRVPYPKDAETFWKLVKLGGELRQLHLLESPLLKKSITTYPKAGDNLVARKIVSKDWELYDANKCLGRIWINDEQYIDAIPLIAWEFYIGGYQPAQKWLKDRVGRTLTLDDIRHYQKIIVALKETDRLMQEIDQAWKP